MAVCTLCKGEMMNGVSCTAGREVWPRPDITKMVGKVITYNCPDCGTPVGGLHHPGCDIEQCPQCGGQMISCDCDGIGWN